MGGLSIGQLAEHTGVAPETLRAWERRHDLLDPQRTVGGHRRYGEADVKRVMDAQRLLDQGLSISTAARRLRTRDAPAAPGVARLASRLRERTKQASDRCDASSLHACLRDAHQQLGLPSTIDRVVVPVLRRVGDEWQQQQSPRSIAIEHVTTAVVRSFLLQLVRDLATQGPTCVVASPEGDDHDLGAVMAAAVMTHAGWQPLFLGASTPWASIETMVGELRPRALLLSMTRQQSDPPPPPGWRPPPGTAVVIGGAGVPEDHTERLAFAYVHHGGFAELPASVAALDHHGVEGCHQG